MNKYAKSALKVAGATALGAATGYAASQGTFIDPATPDALASSMRDSLPAVGEAVRNTAAVFGIGTAGHEIGKHNALNKTQFRRH